ncbi:MAG: hypothetical protein ISS25_02780 [Nanoarchaeota archaeon]|nr:hypothetical protein [DPANN group archaeon]MBL7116728.1 hypothetical protein [Nanoarchaeota archaeon]
MKLLSLLPKKDRILLYISWAVKISILVVFVTSIIRFRIFLAGLSLLVLLISFLPSLIEKRFKIILPPEFETLFALFLYASFILGELKDYYTIYPWWDIVLHSLSAIMIGLIGFMIIYSLYYTHKVVFAPHFAALFSFSFALAIGALWEIFEFGMDSFFGFSMLKSGLMDTMWDLIVDSIGALIVSISGYFYLKGGDSFIMERFVKKFIELNERRLKKKHELL